MGNLKPTVFINTCTYLVKLITGCEEKSHEQRNHYTNILKAISKIFPCINMMNDLSKKLVELLDKRIQISEEKDLYLVYCLLGKLEFIDMKKLSESAYVRLKNIFNNMLPREFQPNGIPEAIAHLTQDFKDIYKNKLKECNDTSDAAAIFKENVNKFHFELLLEKYYNSGGFDYAQVFGEVIICNYGHMFDANVLTIFLEETLKNNQLYGSYQSVPRLESLYKITHQYDSQWENFLNKIKSIKDSNSIFNEIYEKIDKLIK